MITEPPESNETSEFNQDAVNAIVRRGPNGAIAVAGVAVLLVLAIWFAFYLLVFVPRG